MRILWIKANKLLPVSSGGDIRSYHIARRLAQQHQLVFLSYYEGPEDRAYAAELQKHFPGSVAICTGRGSARSLAGAIEYVGSVFHPAPFSVNRFATRAVKNYIQSLFAEKRFDVVVCDFLDAAINIPANVAVPVVLFQHNVESEIWRRHSETESNPVKRAVYKLEFKKMLAYEQSAVRRFQHVIAVSEHDASIMAQWTDRSRITVVPTGVDLGRFQPDWRDKLEPMTVFIGAMDWEPNVDAVEYFCDQVWAEVLAKVPQAKFRIVGRNPDGRVQKRRSASVEVTGSVPSVLEHLHEAAAVVVPLRIGGGTRIKIYEAMAAGKAVVSTSVGAEGLDVHSGRDIILADDPKAFAESVISLLQDAGARERIGRSAAELASHYGWPAIGDKFGSVLEAVAGSPRGARAENAQELQPTFRNSEERREI